MSWEALWRRSRWVRLAVFGLAYFVFSEAGDWLTDSASQFSTFWPASGIYLGALLLSSRRDWPWLVAVAAAADALVAWTIGRSVPVAVATMIANPMEAMIGAWLVEQVTGPRPSIARRRSVLALLFLGAGLAPAVAALVGAIPVSFRYGQPLAASWFEWWAGDALGILILTPLLLAWARSQGPSRSAVRRRPVEFGLLLLAVTAMSWAVFRRTGEGVISHQYLLLPIMVWAALRFGVRGVTAAGFLLGSTAAVVATRAAWAGGSNALAPDAGPLQLVLAVGVGTTLILAAVLAEQRRTERALRLARFALDHGSDGFAVIDPGGRITFANEGAGRMLGCPARDLVGRAIGDADPALPPERWQERWRELRAGAPVLYETGLASGPSKRTLEVGLSYLSFGGQEYGVWSARDVSDRKRAEAAQRLASVGTLAAGVAHEINNPLTYVASNLAFVGDLLSRLRGTHADVAEAESAVREAIEGARRVRNIVRDLKFVSRAPDDQRVEVDLHAEIRTALNLAQSEIRHRARLVTRLEPVPAVLSAEGQLGQVFVNLLVNAAQAIPEGRPSENEVRVVARTDARGWAVVEVSDTGAGIPAAVRPRIFEPFFTTKPVGTGTGLGLSICHGIVTSLGGDVEVESAAERGTTFRVRLPPAQPAAARPAPSAPPPARPVARGRVLVVDDEPLIGKSVSRMLAREHDVVSTTDPRQALTRLLSGERFDLVLCDVMMPGMSGVEFLKELERRRPSAAEPVVFITGGPFTPDARDLLERSGHAHLQKPFEMDALRRLLEERMARATVRSA